VTRDVEATGDRVEELLATLRSGEDRETAEELVRELMDLYGTGLGRVVAIVREHDAQLLGRIASDDLVRSLLLLHDLHPDDVGTRIRRALAGLPEAEFLGTDGGVARVRLTAGGCGSAARARIAEQAVLAAAPEVTSVEITTAGALLQIGIGPPPGWGVAS
jgi:hypothetical protein